MRNFNSRRVLFDTNIIMDAIDAKRPDCTDARKALRLCNGGGDMGLVTAGSLKDAYYSFSKSHGAKKAREAVRRLLDLLVILPLEAEATYLAAESDEPDFEDALVRAVAELNQVSFILTRDGHAFRNSTVRSVTCSEYLEIVAAGDKKIREHLTRYSKG